MGRPSSAPPAGLGTQVVRGFDLVAARTTGLRDHEAAEAARGWTPATTASRPDEHKAYYPGAAPISIRVTGDTSGVTVQDRS